MEAVRDDAICVMYAKTPQLWCGKAEWLQAAGRRAYYKKHMYGPNGCNLRE